MTEPPSRIQGGVYIWTCALFAVPSAIAVIFRSYDGFWEFFATCLLAAGIACLAYYLVKMLICKRAGSLDGERGPMAGLVSMGASIFVVGYYTRLRTYPAEPSYVWNCMVWGFSAIAITLVLLLGGRGLNRYDNGLRKSCVVEYWNGMTEKAQIATFVMGTVPALVALLGICDILAGGMSLKLWMVLGNLIFMTGVMLALFGWSRKAFLVIIVKKRSFQQVGPFPPEFPDLIWHDSLTIQDFCAALAASGLVSMVFFFSPWLLLNPVLYLLITAVGVFVGFLALFVALNLDLGHICNLLRRQWRKETIALLQLQHGESVKRHRQFIRERVLASFKTSSDANWSDLTLITSLSERVRRFLNMKFCQDGRMRYITRYTLPDRREVLLRYVGEKFDDGLYKFPGEDDVDDYERMTDEQLLAKVSGVSSGNAEGSLPSIETYVKTCVNELSARIDWSQIRPRCRFRIDIRKESKIRALDVEMNENGDAVVSDAVVSENNVLHTTRVDKLDETIERELTYM